MSIVYCVGCCVYSQDVVMWALSEALQFTAVSVHCVLCGMLCVQSGHC